MNQKDQSIRSMVESAVRATKITDIHTHLYTPAFGGLLLWGVDELLTYHYLVAETMRWVDMPYNDFWAMSKRDQADLIWKTLFIDHSPISESCRGVLTVLDGCGLDVSTRNLKAFRAYFDGMKVEEYVDKVFETANLESVVMTNDPFDDLERPVWMKNPALDARFHAALRVDPLLNSWEDAAPRLKSWGYNVDSGFSGATMGEVRRFLTDWIDRIDALYLAVSLPPTFAMPEDSARARLIEECIIPVCREKGIPFAMMIGVKKLVNPELRLAGDSVGKGSIESVEYLCAKYPQNKFMLTMLSRENMHEMCIAARKFRNLMIFGCWWFLNNPSLIEEITRMRFELLGESMIPQHSDSRVLDQLIYKWVHSRKIIGDVLVDKYTDLAETGWQVSNEEIRRDVADIFGRNFWRFLER
ncbi:MAG: glucuronate isomerase [Armatimonadota bacterium]|jgi:hypothetical protein